MDSFEAVRQNAEALHADLTTAGANAMSPTALVLAAIEELELDLHVLEADDPALKGSHALYDDQAGHILCRSFDDEIEKALVVSHEIGHARLHAGSSGCHESDVDLTQSTEVAPVGLDRVEDYGARERRELQANVFAREFVLPRETARHLFLNEKLSARDISAATGLPLTLVRQQLFDALLLPNNCASNEPQKPKSAFVATPDKKQDTAAEHAGTAFQLQAGPGTGKTRTLIKRIDGLLEKGVDPASILVLTFSNRAAGELSERLIQAHPEVAARIWVGTFHAFGLDLVRKHHDLLDVSNDPALFDRSDAIAVLEERLPTLPLVHYRDLWDPARVLREIINAISRAKDELVDPVAYRVLAEAMSAQCDPLDSDAIKAAEKCLEIADVYDLYQAALRDHGGVDFGDLIMRPTVLLETNKAVRVAAQLRHRHILVDEYQDVNRASARLLKAVAGHGQNLWVVGDSRQSIYRFRGASSRNMAEFANDYPGATIDRLEKNYRSTQEVVDGFTAFDRYMGASKGMLALSLSAEQGAGSAVPEVRAYPTLDQEAFGVAESIKELVDHGVPYKDQTVLCRSNRRLDEIAERLEAEGVPILHLGSLFERDEIRNFLCILKFLVDPFGDALIRIAAMPRYGIPLQDAYNAMAQMREASDGRPASTKDWRNISGLSEKGCRGLERLCEDLSGHTSSSSPWNLLADYLLDKTDLVRGMCDTQTVASQLRAVALWQFLNFVRDQRRFGAGPPITRLLDKIRQLVLLAEERDLRQVPEAALHLNAVRMMTVHGSKGLEFEAVHVPGMTVASFPASNQGQRCPPPSGMIDGEDGLDVKAAAKKAHQDEEQCLFFVAASRAKRYLRLYRSKTQPNGTSTRNPSQFLDWFPSGGLLARDVQQENVGVDLALPAISVTRTPEYATTHGELQAYEKCPRRYFYTHVMSLGGARKSTAFSKTHDCLYKLLGWIAEARATQNPTLEQTETAFEAIWQESGPVDHAFEDQYRTLASRLIESVVRSGHSRTFRAAHPIAVDNESGRFLLEPDEIADLADGRVAIRRVRTGYKRSDEYRRLEYALYLIAAETEFGGNAIVEALHLTDDVSEPVTMGAKALSNNREKTKRLLSGIRDGDFPVNRQAAVCPRCPHFFACAAAPAGSVTVS